MRAQKRPRPASPSSPPLQCSQNLNGEQNDQFDSIKLSKIRKEVQCPICLGILRKTRTVMECLHRFCKECIDKSMRLGKHECPLCRTHCSNRRSLRDDPNFDALIAAIYPDIDKYDKEELAFHKEDGSSKKQIQDSTATASVSARNVVKTRRHHPTSEHQGSDDECGVESASGTDIYNNMSTDQIGCKLNDLQSNRDNKNTLAPGTQTSSSKSIEKLLQVFPVTSHPPAVPKVLNEAWSSLNQAISTDISQVVEAAGSEGEKAKNKVEELELQVAELTRYKLRAEAHEKRVDALTGELKMSTDQVSRLVAELETTNQEQGGRLQKLGQVQNVNSRLIKESKISMHKVSELEQKTAEFETTNKEQALRLQEFEQLQSENPQVAKEYGDEGGVDTASWSQFFNQLENRFNSLQHEAAEVTRCVLLLAEGHKKKVDALTGKLKMLTDQVSRLERKIAELETTTQEQGVRLQELGQVQNENSGLKKKLKISTHKVSGLEQKIAELETAKKEQALRLHKLVQLQSENPQLVKECVRRLFRTKGFEDFIRNLMIPAYKYGAHRCAVSVMEHHREIPLKVFEGKGYDPTIEEELNIVCANALMNNDLDFPLLHEIASLAQPLTLSTLKRLVADEKLETVGNQ